MAKPYDLSKPLLAFDHNATLVAVIELSGKSLSGDMQNPPGDDTQNQSAL